jgi:hypothetical protein
MYITQLDHLNGHPTPHEESRRQSDLHNLEQATTLATAP